MEFLEMLQATGSVLLTLLAFLLVLVLAWWTVRMLGRHYTLAGGGGRYMKVLEKLPLSQDKSLCIVQVEQQAFLLGVAPQSIQVICALEGDKLTPLPEETIPLPFAQMLKGMLSGQAAKGKGEKGC